MVANKPNRKPVVKFNTFVLCCTDFLTNLTSVGNWLEISMTKVVNAIVITLLKLLTDKSFTASI